MSKERIPPEQQLIDLCRQLKRDYPEIDRISFKVLRADDEWQSYSIGDRIKEARDDQ